ncbi:MAG TPA: hypothetical protein VF544_21265 [Pyrinomonadaceae bacterium]
MLEAKRSCSRRFLRPHAYGAAAGTQALSPRPDQNAVGVGVGEKVVDGLPTGILCVRIYVRAKFPSRQLLRRERLPKTTYGLPVDVIETSTFRSLVTSVVPQPGTAPPPLTVTNLTMPNPRTRFRPSRPGCSVSFAPAGSQPTAGTYGALVQDADGFYILSNNHILANKNRLPINSDIFQPGVLDDPNSTGNRIGSLSNFEPLVVGAPNRVDCAVARIPAGQALNEILHIGAPRSKGNATVGMNVHKFGRSTSYRVGQVEDIDADVTLNYGMGALRFDDQIVISGLNGKAFAQRGDSGALVLERETQTVGLLFGSGVNSSGQIFAVANHINDVLNALGVTLVL